MWHQLLNDNTTYHSASATGWAVYAFAVGVKVGVLPEAEYLPVIMKSWSAVGALVEVDGMVDGE